MGFNLGDLGSFAVGAINQDKENTAAKLEERKDELKANRAFIIKMKENKYQSELATFEEENKKAKAIAAINNKYKAVGGEINPIDYGRDYILATNPTEFATMTALYKDNQPKLEEYYASFANKASSEFKPTTTRDALDAKQAEDIQSITAEFNKKIENARGDSFLINQIIGLKNKAINKITEKNKEGEAGTILAKEIQKEIETVKPEESDSGLVFAEASFSKPTVPEWFIKKGKLEEKRTQLNSSDNLLSYTDAGIKAGLDFFKNNKFTKIKSFIQKDKGGKYIGFEGAGAMVVNHIAILGNGAVDSITDRVVYDETNGKASMASSVLNPSVVKAKVTERVNDYTNISQSKNFLKDRENIISIVPFSIVDANNSLGDITFETKRDRKTVGESYYKALQQFTKENNKRQVGIDEQGQPIYSIIKSNQQFMNDIQTELLNLRGNTNNNANRIKELMMIDLGIGTSKDESTPPASGSDTPLPSSSDTPPASGDVKTMIITAPNGQVETVEDTPDSRKLAKEKGFIIKEPLPLVPQETDEGYDPEYNTGKDRSITAGTIRRLKRGNTIPMSQKERLEARRIQNEFRKKQKQLLDNKKRNESLGLPEITPLTSE
jgi:hypothetical protein